jgi:hypothetical protein
MEIDKDWYQTVKVYHESDFKSLNCFLGSPLAAQHGFSTEDYRKFRRAAQTFDAKWQAAIRAYQEGKFSTRKAFISSSKFLSLGFTPSREHGHVLRYALQFYDEEFEFRQSANSKIVSAASRWGVERPCIVSPELNMISNLISYENDNFLDIEAVRRVCDADSVDPSELSQISGESSTTGYSSADDEEAKLRLSHPDSSERDYIEEFMRDLTKDPNESNGLATMIVFLFAIVPLIIFSKMESTVSILLPRSVSKSKRKDDETIDPIGTYIESIDL